MLKIYIHYWKKRDKIYVYRKYLNILEAGGAA